MNHIRDLQEKLSALHFELEEEDDAGQRYSKSFISLILGLNLLKKLQLLFMHFQFLNMVIS